MADRLAGRRLYLCGLRIHLCGLRLHLCGLRLHLCSRRLNPFRIVQNLLVVIIAMIHNIRLTTPKPILLLLQSSKILLRPLAILLLRSFHPPFLRRARHSLHRFRVFEQFSVALGLLCSRHRSVRVQILVEAESFVGVPKKIVGRVREDGVQAGSVEGA